MTHLENPGAGLEGRPLTSRGDEELEEPWSNTTVGGNGSSSLLARTINTWLVVICKVGIQGNYNIVSMIESLHYTGSFSSD